MKHISRRKAAPAPPAQPEFTAARGLRHPETTPHRPPGRTLGTVLQSSIDAMGWDEALARIDQWAERHESRCVYLCNVHSVVTAQREPAFRKVVQAADMALPDGAPIAWSLRRAGHTRQPRLSGPDLEWLCLEQAERAGHVVSFYGSTDAVLAALRRVLSERFPRLLIGVMVSPPFRALSAEEDAAYVERINAAGTRLLFVGLGCPKQEHWMAAHRGRIQATMLGVGAAFAYHAGTVKRAPLWMQQRGMEWMHRLYSEPRRLAWRYLTTNSIFVLSVLAKQVRAIGRRR
jgi:N-acetylglucosaminyldiphosphoundecaprenol N-acetyl-beta-D-mannosaminyltransferase